MFKAGDKVLWKKRNKVITISGVSVSHTMNMNWFNDCDLGECWLPDHDLELVGTKIPVSDYVEHNRKTYDSKPDGGPSEYYDLPFKDWTTVNDMVEYLSEKQWGIYSWIFKDILKACTRFGEKVGTDKAYDAKKIIYYGARLLMSLRGKKALRDYLQQLLDDRQFNE